MEVMIQHNLIHLDKNIRNIEFLSVPVLFQEGANADALTKENFHFIQM